MRNQTPLFIAFFIAIAMTVLGWPSSDQVLSYTGGIHGYDGTTGMWKPFAVTGDGKVMTDSSVTIGSITVDPAAPPTANLQSVVAVTTTAANVVSLANRKSLAIFNHSMTTTLWASLDAVTASATVDASIPIPPMGYISTELDASKIISLVASEAINATVYQDGY